MRFVGDVMLARTVEHLMDLYGTSYPVSGLSLHPDDAYLVGNFESSVPAIHVPTKSMTFSFSAKEEDLFGVKEYGFTHFGLANNHTYDFGIDNYKHTVRALQDASFAVFGSQGELATSSVVVADLGSSTIALIGVYAVYEKPSLADIVAVFKHANAVSDKQIAYVHWGDEYELVHNTSQEDLAHALIDAGADTVIGHHPHVIQDIGLYRNVPIFYSLGNFIFDQYFSLEVQEGLMLDLTLTESGYTFELLPVTSIGSRSVPRFASSYEKDAILEKLAKNSDLKLREMIKKGLITLDF
jgi:poly-gamma-glutamate synthesis protein (capsule biosynthesis protein)